MLFKRYEFEELNSIGKKLKEKYPDEEILDILPERIKNQEYYMGIKEMHKLLRLIYLYIVKKETK